MIPSVWLRRAVFVLLLLAPPIFAGTKRASIVFRDSTQVYADIFSARDSSVSLTNIHVVKPLRPRREFQDTTIILLSNVKKITLVGHAHVGEGAGIGAAVGGVVGGMLGWDASRKSTGDAVSVAVSRRFSFWGGMFLGILGGGIIGLVVGGNNVTDRYEIDPLVPEQVELLHQQIEDRAAP